MRLGQGDDWLAQSKARSFNVAKVNSEQDQWGFIVSVISWEGDQSGVGDTGWTINSEQDQWGFIVSVILWEGEPIRGGRHRVNYEQWTGSVGIYCVCWSCSLFIVHPVSPTPDWSPSHEITDTINPHWSCSLFIVHPVSPTPDWFALP